MHLYAPIVGNRLVHSMAVKAWVQRTSCSKLDRPSLLRHRLNRVRESLSKSFEDKHKMPIEEVMKIICEKRDSEALENLRCFYTKNLDELDKNFMNGII